MAQGAIIYKPSNFPLSYITTPWGVTALQGGTSAIPSTMRIYWAKDVLVLSLYNITWSNIGTISGSGSIGIKLKPQNQVSINSSVSMLQLNCSCGRFNLKNSLLQLKTLLQNDAPENILLSYEEGSDWLMITVTSTNTAKINMKLLIRNVEAVLD
ncbi:MAG: hypothetical protein N3E48_02225 [Candidatus Bathyarchaeota archaeon]|nr:hypothetical protein [Candidatus Bathyarchaeota archaeon]